MKGRFQMKNIIKVDSALHLFPATLFFTPERRKELFPLAGDMGIAYKNGFVYLVKWEYITPENIDKKKRYIETLNGKGFYMEVLDYVRISELKQRNKDFRKAFA